MDRVRPVRLFGQEPTAWIATVDPPLYRVVLVTVRLWLQVGLYMILFLAAIQEIPGELYEAARVDGTAVTLLLVIAAFQAFDEFYNLLSRPPLVYLYDVALGQQNYGVGSAGALAPIWRPSCSRSRSTCCCATRS